jgi:hypothetical protein
LFKPIRRHFSPARRLAPLPPFGFGFEVLEPPSKRVVECLLEPPVARQLCANGRGPQAVCSGFARNWRLREIEVELPAQTKLWFSTRMPPARIELAHAV